MGTFFQEIQNFLATSPGNLIYHLVLVFAVFSTLMGAFIHWRISEFPQARRAVSGLVVLLLLQLLLFLASGLAWQRVIDPNLILPPLDRALTFISLVWITWLWTFPEPSRPADAGSILLSLFAVTGLVLNILYRGQTGNEAYNGSLPDILWQVFSLGLLAFGMVILVVRRPSGWGNGVAALGLVFVGHALHLLLNAHQGDFAGLARLTDLAAYILLMTLPYRFPTPLRQPIAHSPDSIIQERRRYSTDPKTFNSLLALAGEMNAERVSRAITRALAQTMLADLCFLLQQTDDHNQVLVASGYDLIREENLEGSILSPNTIPMLFSSMQRGRALRLPASSTSGDLKGLSELLGLGSPGHLMFVPIQTPEKQSFGGLLLLSPYSNRLWSAEDQSFLSNIAAALVPIIRRGQQIATLENKGHETAQVLESERSRVAEMERRNQELVAQMEAVMQDAEKSQQAAQSVDALRAAEEDARQTIVQLQQENEALRAAEGRQPLNSTDVTHIEKELRLSLKEVARLQNQVAEANIKVLELEKQKSAPATNEQAEIATSISQELRQPMSSIIGYTDLLLGESVGILGALQRKFVERIKTSIERVRSLIDDLIQITTLESGLAELKPEPVDLNLVIDNAMSYTSSQVREKNISMHLDLPKSIAPIYADREALQQILIHLLQNAGAATPVEGTVSLSVKTRSEDGLEYVLIQVADSGGGIPAEDLSRVFSRLYRADNVLIQGIGDTGVGLSIAKTLTEAQHGRIWVESEMDKGSTFSVLLPISTAPAKEA